MRVTKARLGLLFAFAAATMGVLLALSPSAQAAASFDQQTAGTRSASVTSR